MSSPTNISMYCGISSLLHVHDGSDLDGVSGPRLRQRHSRGRVGELKDGDAADGLLGFDERSVDDRDLTVALADGRRRSRGLKLRAFGVDLRTVRLEPLEDLPVDRLLLGRGVALGLHAVMDEEERVLRHPVLLLAVVRLR